MIAGKLPPADDPEWREVYDEFAKGDLPKDLPLPALTPYDTTEEGRKRYLNGYRLGLIVGLRNEMTPDDLPFSEAYREGFKNGEHEGARVRLLRELVRKADREARWGPHPRTSLHEVGEGSPPEERKMLDAFTAFAGAFERTLRRVYPNTLEFEVIGAPRLCCDAYDDYNSDNTGEPQKRYEFSAMLQGKGHKFGWIQVRPKDPAKPGPNNSELGGTYQFDFEYDESTGRWSLEPDPRYSDGRGRYEQLQDAGKAGSNEHQWKESPLARKLITRAIDEAQPGAPPQQIPLPKAKPPLALQPLDPPRIARLAKPVRAFYFSPDARRTLVLTETPRFWDARTLEPLATLVNSNGLPDIAHAAFSPDGRRLATGGFGREAVIWDVETGKALLSVAHQPAGTYGVWNPFSKDGVEERRRVNWITAVGFTQDGRRLLTAGSDFRVRVWDAFDGRPIVDLKHTYPVNYAAFSPDGRRILTSSSDYINPFDHSGRIGVWDADSGRELWHLDTNDSEHHDPALSPAGKMVAFGGIVVGMSVLGERVTLLNAENGKVLAMYPAPQGIHFSMGVQFSPDASRLLLAGYSEVQLVEPMTGKPLCQLISTEPGDHPATMFSPDGRYFAVACNYSRAAVWDAATGAKVLDMRGKYVQSQNEKLFIAFSADSARIAVTYPREEQTIIWALPAGATTKPADR
jgi:WD40 repeat protein